MRISVTVATTLSQAGTIFLAIGTIGAAVNHP